jgi:acyl dehydratase
MRLAVAALTWLADGAPAAAEATADHHHKHSSSRYAKRLLPAPEYLSGCLTIQTALHAVLSAHARTLAVLVKTSLLM